MADQTYSFRSALNGFHRADVISFLGELSRKHEAELEEKTEALRHAKEEIARLQQEIDCLKADNNRTVVQMPEPQQHPIADVQGQELEAYRRAERFEREARLRAGKIYGDVSAAVDSAGKQLCDQEKYLTKVSAAISSDIAALQAAMGDIRIQLNATRDHMNEMVQDLQSQAE